MFYIHVVYVYVCVSYTHTYIYCQKVYTHTVNVYIYIYIYMLYAHTPLATSSLSSTFKRKSSHYSYYSYLLTGMTTSPLFVVM